MNKEIIVCWFSCGIASAVATKITIDKYKDNPNVVLRVVCIKIAEEHPDNERFLVQCEAYFNHKIEIIKNKKFNGSIYNVFKLGYLAGTKGAPCTTKLKKEPRIRYIKALAKEYDVNSCDIIQVFGFTAEEKNRFDRLGKTINTEIEAPLIDKGLSKQDCFYLFRESGIERPIMYSLGFNNNNCIGCVKGGGGYWNMVKKQFPAEFEKMAVIERQLNHSILKKYFLDELPEQYGRHDLPVEECSLFCQLELVSRGDQR